MPIEDLPIFCHYDRQRFRQFSPMDAANWYITNAKSGKKQQALYPAMGRRHIRSLNQNVLIFNSEPRFIFRSIDFVYIIVGTVVYQMRKNYTTITLFNIDFNLPNAPVWFAYLPVGNKVLCLLTNGVNLFLIDESIPGSMVTVTDANRPSNPLYVAAFGNRFVVSQRNSNLFYLTQVDAAVIENPAAMFTPQVFASASGKIKQFAVLHNQLYIFNDFTCDVWSNIPSTIGLAQFPWKLNASYNFDYGMADPFSLSVDFGMMVWLAKSRSGLVNFMMSDGGQPKPISTQAINVLLQKQTSIDGLKPFLEGNADGFLYQYEDTIFYRISAGDFMDFGSLDIQDSSNCIEYNFDTQSWHRAIELNGERNRIKKHVFYNDQHLVTVSGQSALFEMAGNIYYNELLNPDQPNHQATDAFLAYPFRYELQTPIIAMPDYSEFITNYVEIDFVFGDSYPKSEAPFANAVFLVSEESTDETVEYLVAEDGTTFLIDQDGNYPSMSEPFYNALFKPHIELYYSNDGGITFESADVREFSQLGVYQWRMRWYQLGASRNRVYKLVCVSDKAIVVLGGVQNLMRSSGGAN